MSSQQRSPNWWAIIGWVVVILATPTLVQRTSRIAQADDRERQVDRLLLMVADAQRSLNVISQELAATEATTAEKVESLNDVRSRLADANSLKRRLGKRASNLSDKLFLQSTSGDSGGSAYSDLPPGVDPWPDQSDFYDPCIDEGVCGEEGYPAEGEY